MQIHQSISIDWRVGFQNKIPQTVKTEERGTLLVFPSGKRLYTVNSVSCKAHLLLTVTRRLPGCIKKWCKHLMARISSWEETHLFLAVSNHQRYQTTEFPIQNKLTHTHRIFSCMIYM